MSPQLTSTSKGTKRAIKVIHVDRGLCQQMRIFVCLIRYVPVNNFSVILGRAFLG